MSMLRTMGKWPTCDARLPKAVLGPTISDGITKRIWYRSHSFSGKAWGSSPRFAWRAISLQQDRAEEWSADATGQGASAAILGTMYGVRAEISPLSRAGSKRMQFGAPWLGYLAADNPTMRTRRKCSLIGLTSSSYCESTTSARPRS